MNGLVLSINHLTLGFPLYDAHCLIIDEDNNENDDDGLAYKEKKGEPRNNRDMNQSDDYSIMDLSRSGDDGI